MNIKERAEENASLECFDKHRSGKYHQGLVEGYITGAMEQREIDIENTCEWVATYISNFIDADGRFHQYAFVKEFTKDMRGE